MNGRIMNTTLELSEINRQIGQFFMTGIPDISLDNQTLELIREFNLGGIILFSRNIENPIQIAKLCQAVQDEALKAHGHRIFISIDQEGGRVARLKTPFTEFPGNSVIGIEDDPETRAREFGRITAEEMKLVGINMNLAPVVDVQRGELEKHLLGRAFSENPAIVSLLGGTVIKFLQDNGVMAVAKHFPGLGRATIDPHLNLPRIDTDIEELEDGLIIKSSKLQGAKVCGHNDHRVVMALSLAGLISEGQTEIDTAESIDVTFPGYVEVMQNIKANMQLV